MRSERQTTRPCVYRLQAGRVGPTEEGVKPLDSRIHGGTLIILQQRSVMLRSFSATIQYSSATKFDHLWTKQIIMSPRPKADFCQEDIQNKLVDCEHLDTTTLHKPTMAKSSKSSSREKGSSDGAAGKFARQKKVDDYSNVTAHGTHALTQESQEQLNALRAQVAASPRLQQFVHGTAATTEHAVKRQEILKRDDVKPNFSGLSDKQRYSLQKRKQHRNKALQARLHTKETKQLQAAVAAADAQEILGTSQAGMIQPENDMERTTALTQKALKHSMGLDTSTTRHIFDLTLTECSPYGLKYDRSGRHSVLFGQKGHLAILDNHTRSLAAEWNVQERIRDACFLHNSTMIAVAQKNVGFIYDTATGAEIHRLGEHVQPLKLDFLPYHWLLVSIGRAGWLKYQDTSTGKIIISSKTGLPNTCLHQNPSNAVMHVGHTNGTVTLWTPSSSKYLVKMLCHKGSAITSMAIDPTTGYTMVTGGADRQVRVWDLRMYKERHSYYCRAGVPTTMDISQRGMLAVGHAGHVEVWDSPALPSKVAGPYLHEMLPRCGPIETVRFRPFEDIMGVGHARGISSMVVPGSGEPNIDTSEYHLNPMAETKELREAEVRALLDKLQPEMISLDTTQVGGIEASNPHLRMEQDADRPAQVAKKKRERQNRRGQSKIQVKLRRKDRALTAENREKYQESKKQQRESEQEEQKALNEDDGEDVSRPSALRRFF